MLLNQREMSLLLWMMEQQRDLDVINYLIELQIIIFHPLEEQGRHQQAVGEIWLDANRLYIAGHHFPMTAEKEDTEVDRRTTTAAIVGAHLLCIVIVLDLLRIFTVDVLDHHHLVTVIVLDHHRLFTIAIVDLHHRFTIAILDHHHLVTVVLLDIHHLDCKVDHLHVIVHHFIVPPIQDHHQ